MGSKKAKHLTWMYNKFSYLVVARKQKVKALIENNDLVALDELIKEQITELYNIADCIDSKHKYSFMRYFEETEVVTADYKQIKE